MDAWNTWYDWYGNTAEGFGSKVREIDDACERAGRDPATLERSACVLVRLGDSAERPDEAGVTPLDGSLDAIGAGLREIADAGADELILVLDPITEGVDPCPRAGGAPGVLSSLAERQHRTGP